MDKLHEQLAEALRKVQFGFNFRRCPACAGFNVGPNGETDNAHRKDCPVFLALAAYDAAKEMQKREASLLAIAARDLYTAGRWECKALTNGKQSALWEALRDALGLPVGTATSMGLGSPPPEQTP